MSSSVIGANSVFLTELVRVEGATLWPWHREKSLKVASFLSINNGKTFRLAELLENFLEENVTPREKTGKKNNARTLEKHT